MEYRHAKGKLFYNRRGKGKTIVLIHGVLCSHNLFNPVFDSLARHFDTIAVDLPGHGNSSPVDGNYFEETGRILSGFIDSIGSPVYALIGQSMGGLFINSMLDSVMPEKVVYISPAFSPAKALRIPAKFPSVSEFLLDSNKVIAKTSRIPVKILALMGVDNWKDTGFLADMALHADPGSVSRALYDVMYIEHEIEYRKETDFLLIHGNNDRLVSIKDIAKKLHCRSILVPDANHAAMIEQPGIVAEKILGFLTPEASS